MLIVQQKLQGKPLPPLVTHIVTQDQSYRKVWGYQWLPMPRTSSRYLRGWDLELVIWILAPVVHVT